MVTVVGLGALPLGERVKKEIARADRLFCRTFLSRAGQALQKLCPQAESMDDLYEDAPDFETLNKRIVARLSEAIRTTGNVGYFVDGDGYTDGTVEALEGVLPFTVSAGEVEDRRAAADCAVISAYSAATYTPDTSAALRVYGIDGNLLASDVKLSLFKWYAPEKTVYFYRDGKESAIPLEALDRQCKYGYSCSVFLPAETGVSKSRYCFGDLLRILTRLTGEGGCPWDRAQTHDSIRTNMLEEAYEAVDAIDKGDTENLAEELGDVLLQSVFHCDIAGRSGEFDLGDVLTGLCAKLVGRHTHIFGENRATDSESALAFWEQAKAVEKKYTGLSDRLTGIPDSFSALLRAQKTVKKLLKNGAASVLPAMDAQGIAQTAQTLAAGDEKAAGELLLSVVSLVEAKGIDCETALHARVRALVRAAIENEEGKEH